MTLDNSGHHDWPDKRATRTELELNDTVERSDFGRGGATVRATAATVDWSERQLERVFQLELGLSPELFARIVRLRRGLAAAKAGATLATAAAAAGYADQSHSTRETQAFMSGSPSSLLPNVGNVQDILPGQMAD